MEFLQPHLAIPPDPGQPAPRDSLLYLADEGRVVVPRFQRDYEWKPDFVVSLLASVARGWPCGQLLLMEGDRDFPSRTLRGVDEEVGNTEFSVLDGQQRLTALYRAFFDKDPKRVFYFRIADYVREGQITDESFAHVVRGTWSRICPDLDSQASPPARRAPGQRSGEPARVLYGEGSVVTVKTFLDDVQWEAWLANIADGERDDFRRLRAPLAARLRSYQFPVTLIDERDTDETLTSVFVTVNLRQVPLDTFDLIVAKSWRRDTFDLRQIWFQAVGRTREGEWGAEAEYPAIRDYRVQPETLLRLLALLTGAETTSKSELVGLDAQDVRAKAADALRALDAAVRFLKAHAGVIPESLPSDTTLLPLAYVLFDRPGLSRSQTTQAKLLRWFWLTTFGQRYGRGQTNTLVVKDARDLAEWLRSDLETPEAFERFAFKTADLFEDVTGNEMLTAGVFCLENLHGARDWIKGDVILQSGRSPRTGGTEPSSVLARHHIFPKETNRDRVNDSRVGDSAIPWDEPGFDPLEIVANRALLLASTNSSIGHHSPESIETVADIDSEFVTTYLMDWNGDRAFDPFITTRAKLIATNLTETLHGVGFDIEID